MSEFIKARRAGNMRGHFLTTVSALALAMHGLSTVAAKAAGADHPAVWIELGGQAELMQGTFSPVLAPFAAVEPQPAPYRDGALIDTQRPAHLAMGFSGKVAFQPDDSDWVFSAGVRYGRTHANRHVHNQTAIPTIKRTFAGFDLTLPIFAAPFADTKAQIEGRYTIVDFNAGRDIGIGRWGREGASVLSAGIRFAQFSSASAVDIAARPSVDVSFPTPYEILPRWSFYQYSLQAHATRSFHGIGPSLSWSASADLLGNSDAGELALDWGLNAAVLFGRQKAKVSHATQAYRLYQAGDGVPGTYSAAYPSRNINHSRQRSVAVPNLGAFAGISVRKQNAKFSLGYRADFYFGAMDTGIDARHTENLGFNGPFATISIGLGN